MNIKKRIKLVIILMILPLFVTSCFEFISVLQPSICYFNTPFNVDVNIEIDEDGQNQTNFIYFIILLPDNWIVDGNSFSFSGDQTGTIIYDGTYLNTWETSHPAPDSYFWWIGKSVSPVNIVLDHQLNWTLTIIPDDQPGDFLIDYYLAYVYDGFNEDDSFLDLPITLTFAVPVLPGWAIITMIVLFLSIGTLYIYKRL